MELTTALVKGDALSVVYVLIFVAVANALRNMKQFPKIRDQVEEISWIQTLCRSPDSFSLIRGSKKLRALDTRRKLG